MNEGKLPNFQRFYRESQVFITDAEEEGERLNPWVQWVTLHSGVPLDRHGIFRLNETHKLEFDQLWDIVSRAGKKVLVCGSMNPHYKAGLNGIVVPDPWSVDVSPYPAGELEAYYEFVKKNVQGHTADNLPITPKDLARFAWFMARRGLSPQTIRTGLAQLWNERRTGKSRWKRAAILDLLQWDVFRWYWTRNQPAFSTFFLNSTAHYQHAYWRTMEPDWFEIKPSTEELADTKDAIQFGYEAMDRLIARIMEMAGRDVTLIFATGLSQQPYTKAEATGGKRYYRLNDGDSLTKLGVKSRYTYEPVMSDEFFLRFDTEQDAIAAGELLTSFRVLGEDVFAIEVRTGKDLFMQCRPRRVLPRDAMLKSEGRPSVPYYGVVHMVEGLKSGYHHPDGMLWVRQPNRAHQIHLGKVSIRSVAPGILQQLDIPLPAYMDCPSFLEYGKRLPEPVQTN